MPFFLPRRLIEFEYFQSDSENPQYKEEAKPYQNDIDFAFFAANFGYGKAEYDALTPREVNFLYKAWENRIVTESYNIYNSVFTAVYNATRQKGKKALKLWQKNKVKKVDSELVRENINTIKEVESKEGKEWVNKIYQANGIKMPSEAVKHG